MDLTVTDEAEPVESAPVPARPASRTHQRPSTRLPTRLPRYPNPIFEEVIDLESLPDRPTPEVVIDDDENDASDTILELEGQNPSSPEVTFLHARPRANPRPPTPLRRRHSDEHLRRHARHPPDGMPPGFPMNMLFGGGFPFMNGHTSATLEEPGGYPIGPGSLPQTFGDMMGLPRPDIRRPPRRMEHLARLIHQDTNARLEHMHNALGFQQQRLRTMMQGGLGPAFLLENNFVRAREEPAPLPTYEPISDAQSGFTRSPGEDDVLVCPRCDRELCTGDVEEDASQQAWVVKACGHVSCSRYASVIIFANTGC